MKCRNQEKRSEKPLLNFSEMVLVQGFLNGKHRNETDLNKSVRGGGVRQIPKIR